MNVRRVRGIIGGSERASSKTIVIEEFLTTEDTELHGGGMGNLGA
jgi:hypothetical protein